ncbi:MAG: L,D-transpeptidase [Legionellaceae bacterium]|nr:L,D-transpeptidase [Legionellaceae bacterium]
MSLWKRQLWSAPVLVAVSLTACTPVDESTIVLDDQGFAHRTQHYLSDRRGRNHFPLQIAATGRKRFIFDPQDFSWAAYDAEGERLLTGAASGGKDFCEDIGESCRTVSGSFRVYRKKGEECRSGEYPLEEGGGAKMPYCMYFFRGITIHAAYEVPRANSSHGCVRVLPSAAKWLNEQFIDYKTDVIVMDYAPSASEVG